MLSPPRPLHPSDDLQTFDCGRDSINAWFKRRASSNQSRNLSRTWVVAEETTGRIAGFASLTVGSIRREIAARPDQRNTPDPLPILLLGQLAVDRSFQGSGLGVSLLQYALRTGVVTASQVGIFGIVTHPLDADLRRFYHRWGFRDLVADPKGGMIVRIKDLQAAGFDAGPASGNA